MNNILGLESFTIGYADARTDIREFPEAFHITKSFERIYEPLCNIITGKKGTGKTAYLLKLRSMYEAKNFNVIEIIDDEINTYQEIFIKTIDNNEETFLELATVYKSIWENIILERVFLEISNEDSYKKSIYKKDIESYFKSPDSVTSRMFLALNSTFSAHSKPEETSSKPGIGSISMVFLSKFMDKNKNHKKAREALRNYLSNEYNKKLLVLIDDLDRYLTREIDATSKKSLIYLCKGLYFAINSLSIVRYSDNLHIKACLPLVIYNEIKELYDADKMHENHEIISVNKSELKEIMNVRVQIGRKKQIRHAILSEKYGFGHKLAEVEKNNLDTEVMRYMKEHGVPTTIDNPLGKLFEKQKINSYFYNIKAPKNYSARDRDIFDVIYEFTFSTPRDIISIFTQMIKSANKESSGKITNENLLSGVKTWSEEYLNFFINETSFSDSMIGDTVGSFNSRKQTYVYKDFFDLLKARHGAIKAIGDVEDTIATLYNLGFIGRGKRKSTASADFDNITNYDIDFYYNHKVSVNIGMLKEADVIIIHPSFIYSLALTSEDNYHF